LEARQFRAPLPSLLKTLVDAALKETLDKEGRRDPLTHEPFQVGDEVVNCPVCQCFELWQSWQALGGKSVCGYKPGTPIRPPTDQRGRTLPWFLAVAGILLVAISIVFFYENQSYQQARGKIDSLTRYLDNCILCPYKLQAEQELTSLREVVRGVEGPPPLVPSVKEPPVPEVVEPSPPPPPPAAPKVVFAIANNTSSIVNVSFFDGTNRQQIDPVGGQIYVHSGNATQFYSISCVSGQSICYSAVRQGSGLSSFWGVIKANKTARIAA
jgi:hypothetical protein